MSNGGQAAIGEYKPIQCSFYIACDAEGHRCHVW
jgi:hypothetical protein